MGVRGNGAFDAELARLIAAARRTEPYNGVFDAIRLQYERELEQAGASSTKRKQAETLYEARLLKYVREPVFRWSNARRGPELSCGQECAWHELCNLRSARFVPLLLRFERMNKGNIRGLAVGHLAWMGHDRLIPLIARALRSDEPEIVQHAIRGVTFAVSDRRATPAFRRRMFDAIKPFVTGERRLKRTRDPCNALADVPEALTRLDRRSAVRLLTSDACLRPGNPAVLAVLTALTGFDGRTMPKPLPAADPALIWPIYEAAARGKAAVPRRRMDQLRGAALRAAAARAPVRTRAEARAILKEKRADRSWLDAEARAALRACDKLPDPRHALMLLDSDQTSFDPVAGETLHAFRFADHVLSDGLAAYLDSYGNHWRTAKAGLERLRLHAAARILTEAATVFGSEGPPDDNAARLDSSLALSDSQQATLELLGKRVMRAADRIQREVEERMRRHPELFRPSIHRR